VGVGSRGQSATGWSRWGSRRATSMSTARTRHPLADAASWGALLPWLRRARSPSCVTQGAMLRAGGGRSTNSQRNTGGFRTEEGAGRSGGVVGCLGERWELNGWTGETRSLQQSRTVISGSEARVKLLFCPSCGCCNVSSDVTRVYQDCDEASERISAFERLETTDH
jgi:hypothetical protein